MRKIIKEAEYCTKCGRLVKSAEEDFFCDYCGRQLKSEKYWGHVYKIDLYHGGAGDCSCREIIPNWIFCSINHMIRWLKTSGIKTFGQHKLLNSMDTPHTRMQFKLRRRDLLEFLKYLKK
jgi:hypothetical protein